MGDRVKKSLKYSILDGAFASMMVGFGEAFFSAFAVFLKATTLQLGLIGSLPHVLGSVFQIFTEKLLKFFKSRKGFICTGVILQALMYIPVALVYFMGKFNVTWLIFFICLYWIFGSIIGPAWNSWMGDLVDKNSRGSYFGRRNKIAGISTFVSMLLAGYILHRFTDGSLTQYYGFAIIFGIAFTARIISLIYLTKKYEPGYGLAEEKGPGIYSFIKNLGQNNFGILVLYLLMMNFAIFLAGPFFVPYMLKSLEMNYLTFTIITATPIIAKFIFMPVWGKACDRFGAKKVLSLSGFLMPLMPILWMFSQNPLYLVLVQIYAGFSWAGFEIASFSFIFDTTTTQNRVKSVAYMNAIIGIAILLGGITGSMIVKYNHAFWSSYLLVFLLSGLLRYTASFLFVPRLKELRSVEHVSYKKLLLSVVTTFPTRGVVYNLITFGKGTKHKGKPHKNNRLKIK